MVFSRCSPRGMQRSLGSPPVRRYARPMCGRVRLSSDVSKIKLVFSIPPHRPTPNFPPTWNAAPTDQLPIVTEATKVCPEAVAYLPGNWGIPRRRAGCASMERRLPGSDRLPWLGTRAVRLRGRLRHDRFPEIIAFCVPFRCARRCGGRYIHAADKDALFQIPPDAFGAGLRRPLTARPAPCGPSEQKSPDRSDSSRVGLRVCTTSSTRRPVGTAVRGPHAVRPLHRSK
jgi:hypothetical protein